MVTHAKPVRSHDFNNLELSSSKTCVYSEYCILFLDTTVPQQYALMYREHVSHLSGKESNLMYKNHDMTAVS